MSDSKLQKVILGPDWIDMSFGEPKVVANALFKQLNCVGTSFNMPKMQDLRNWEYPPASGKPDLVKLLEDRHGARVVVTSGGKQALDSALRALYICGGRHIYYDVPYYPANPGFIKSAGLLGVEKSQADCFLITSPNNPDGKNYTNVELLNFASMKPTIHDAAYYTDIYLPDGQIPIDIGDMQVFSISKMYGLSGLRVGYVVVHNEKYYNHIRDHIETTTAGVSVVSQDIVRNVESFFKERPDALVQFQQESRKAIADARSALSALDPDVLQLVNSDANSMFAWFKAGPLLDNKSAKVHILDGSIFGQPGMMRMNIALPVSVVQDAVRRLNTNKLKA